MGLSELGIRDFLDELSSDSPAPGGGSTAAFSGALASSLVGMVAKLTLSNEKYRSSWEVMGRVCKKAEDLSSTFLHLLEEDSLAFNTFMKALKLPKETSEEKEIRRLMMQRALKKAAEIPLETLQMCDILSDLALEAVMKGNRNAITDAVTATEMALSSGLAASYNVRINLSGIKDGEFVQRASAEVERILNSINGKVEKARKKLEEELN